MGEFVATKKDIYGALQLGQKQAKRVLQFRNGALRKRAEALKRERARVLTQPVVPIDRPLLRALGDSQTAGVLIAEGDSWFDYPFHDILRMLEDYHAYEVHSVARKGDPIEIMAHGDGQLEVFTRTLERLYREEKIPRAVLLSGGGNDIAGEQFGMVLNHINSPIKGVNQQIVSGLIDERIKLAYVKILSALTTVCDERLNRRPAILIHGYDYPVPDGRGFLGGLGILPGPWLEPGFREKGFDATGKDRTDCIRLMKQIIDRFNSMLQAVSELKEFSHVKYIDLRNALSVGHDYKRFWDNELHPTEKGFELIAKKFSQVLDALPKN
jgi:lysophospholipase L1-like esterase